MQINTTLTAGILHEFSAFRDLMSQLEPSIWSVFLLVPTGRADASHVPAPDQLEVVFEEMADLVSRAPFAIKTTGAAPSAGSSSNSASGEKRDAGACACRWAFATVFFPLVYAISALAIACREIGLLHPAPVLYASLIAYCLPLARRAKA